MDTRVSMPATLADDPENGSYETFDRHPVRTYAGLYAAYHFFKGLFGGQLPDCLITVQRHKGAYGYFSGDRFANVGDPADITDEIALNPAHFRRPVSEILSTLVHEMTHLYQHHFGRPGRGGYHNREWAALMKSVGLIPSRTGKPGGKEIGDRVSHYIEEGGPFDTACRAYLTGNAAVLYQDRAYAEQNGDDQAIRKRLRKAASKTRFTCSDCEEQTAWAKASAHLQCGDCGARMEVLPP